jgi:5'-deoxynucleotidase YfbR-like HD superfamily hydrolase
MSLEEYTDEVVISETQKLLYLYELKHVIRYGQSRTDKDYTESVAEHIYGMHVLCDYFLPLEDPNQALDRAKVSQLVTWHEVGEIELGDIPNVRKTEADRAREAAVIPKTIAKSPALVQTVMQRITDEYETQNTPEAQFVKAIDKIEPLIHSFHELAKPVQHQLQLTTRKSHAAKIPYVHNYPFIARFNNVLHRVMDEAGYFYPEQ